MGCWSSRHKLYIERILYENKLLILNKFIFFESVCCSTTADLTAVMQEKIVEN